MGLVCLLLLPFHAKSGGKNLVWFLFLACVVQWQIFGVAK
jgi:hypothetical protein